MKYKYIGTEEQLIEHGFSFAETASWNGGYYSRCHDGFGCIFIEDECESENVITADDGFLGYIQDLIDDKLVEVIA